MENEPVEMNKISDETKKQMRDFDEQEAYSLLLEIFRNAQITHDYAKFQFDLNEWKKRFDIELFSEELKDEIKKMLSKEFLDKVLKDYVAFEELSKKDPAKGIEKLRKVLYRVENDNNKSEEMLNKELDKLYKEYPLSFLKEKYPHIVGQLLSKSNKTRILEKFDSSLAAQELDSIINNPESYKDKDEFITTIEEWKNLYPTNDFNDKYKSQIEDTLKEYMDKNKLEELFPMSTELDLSKGQVIPLEKKADMNVISKEAMHDFIEIKDRNINDMDSLFNWIYKYRKYINGLDEDVKTLFKDSLEKVYGVPIKQTNYYIPKMSNEDELTLSDYKSMEDTKKTVVMQLFGKLYYNEEFTHDDSYNLGIIYSNALKAKIIEEANIDNQIKEIVQEIPENELTPYETINIEDNTKANINYNDTTIQVENNFEGENIQVVENKTDEINKEELIEKEINEIDTENTGKVNENNNIDNKTEETNVDKPTFKDTLKVEGIELERVESSNKPSSNNTSGAVSSGGGGGVSITKDIPVDSKEEELKEDEDLRKEEKVEPNEIEQLQNNIQTKQNFADEINTPKEEIIIEAEPKVNENDDKEEINAVEVKTEVVRENKPSDVYEDVITADKLDEDISNNEVIDEELKTEEVDNSKENVQQISIEISNNQKEGDEIEEDSEPPIEENTRKSIVQRLISIFQREKNNEIEEIESNNENDLEEIEQNNDENDREREE